MKSIATRRAGGRGRGVGGANFLVLYDLVPKVRNLNNVVMESNTLCTCKQCIVSFRHCFLLFVLVPSDLSLVKIPTMFYCII